MHQNRALDALGLHKLALECANQQALYKKSGKGAADPGFCYELFRRAIVHQDQAAWSLVYEQYKAQVVRWIRQNPAFQSTQQEPDYFVNEAFAKFWHAVSPQKFTQQLETLGAVLLYLKKCVASTLYSHLRALKRTSMCCAWEQAQTSNPAVKRPVERQLVQKSDEEQFWGLIEALLKNEREKMALENFTLDKKARQIQADYAHLFADVQSVYRTKENLLKRFRRNPNLQTWYTGGGN
jgi:hypothetical protein